MLKKKIHSSHLYLYNVIKFYNSSKLLIQEVNSSKVIFAIILILMRKDKFISKYDFDSHKY
jgi:hypothetical protein